MTKEVIPSSPAVVFSLHLNLDGTKENFNQLQIQYHVPVDMAEGEMNSYLDKIFAVVDRRKDYYRLEQLRKSHYEAEVMLNNAKADLMRIHNQHQAAHQLNGGKGKYQPKRGEGQQVLAAKNNVENTQVYIDRVAVQIEAVEKKLGLTSAANR